MASSRRLSASAAFATLALLLVLCAATLAGPVARSAGAIPPSPPPRATNPDSIATFGSDAVLAEGQTTDIVFVVIGDADIAGTVRQSVIVLFGDATIRETANVGRDNAKDDPAVVVVGGTVTTEPGAAVFGSTDVRGFGAVRLSLLSGVWALVTSGHFSFWALLPGMVFFLIIGAIISAICPAYLRSLRERAQSKPLASLGWGALAGFLTPIAIVILALTIIGLIVAVPLLLALPVFGMFAHVVAAYVVGALILQRLWPQRQWVVRATLLGVVLLAFVGAIPLVGGLAVMAVWLVALGAVLSSIVDKMRSPKRAAASAALSPSVPQ